jgi:hypothetical protein
MAKANKANVAGTATTGNSTLYYRRAHPGGGVLGRCSYGIPGVAGIVVFDVALFLPGQPPATLTLQGVTLATPTARNVAGVTSAVVAAGNGRVAAATGTPIATPRKVAKVAAPAAVAALAATAGTPAPATAGTPAPATVAPAVQAQPTRSSVGTLATGMASAPLAGK